MVSAVMPRGWAKRGSGSSNWTPSRRRSFLKLDIRVAVSKALEANCANVCSRLIPALLHPRPRAHHLHRLMDRAKLKHRFHLHQHSIPLMYRRCLILRRSRRSYRRCLSRQPHRLCRPYRQNRPVHHHFCYLQRRLRHHFRHNQRERQVYSCAHVTAAHV